MSQPPSTYCGIAGLEVRTVDGQIHLVMSRPDITRVIELRLDKGTAETLALGLLDHADKLTG